MDMLKALQTLYFWNVIVLQVKFWLSVGLTYMFNFCEMA